MLPIDTQTLAWVAVGDKRLPGHIGDVLVSGAEPLFVSAVTAFKYTDLNNRGRFGADLPLASMLERLEIPVMDFPAAAWLVLATLPILHSDPVDRMLVTHAIHADLTLVTAESVMRDYPVRSLW